MKKNVFLALLLAGASVLAGAQQIADPDGGRGAAASPQHSTTRSSRSSYPTPYYSYGPSLPYNHHTYKELLAAGYSPASYDDLVDRPKERAKAERLRRAGVLRIAEAYFPFTWYQWRGGSLKYIPGKSKPSATPDGELCYVYMTPRAVRRYHVTWHGKPAVQEWRWNTPYGPMKCVNPKLRGAPPATLVEVVTVPEEYENCLDTPAEENIPDKITYRCNDSAPVQRGPVQFISVLGGDQKVLSGFNRSVSSLTSFSYSEFKGGKCIKQGDCFGDSPIIDVPGPVVNPPISTPPNPNENPKPDPVVPNPGAQGHGPDGPGNGGTPITHPVTRGGGHQAYLKLTPSDNLPLYLKRPRVQTT
jgi:hypothetical protein